MKSKLLRILNEARNIENAPSISNSSTFEEIKEAAADALGLNPDDMTIGLVPAKESLEDFLDFRKTGDIWISFKTGVEDTDSVAKQLNGFNFLDQIVINGETGRDLSAIVSDGTVLAGNIVITTKSSEAQIRLFMPHIGGEVSEQAFERYWSGIGGRCIGQQTIERVREQMQQLTGPRGMRGMIGNRRGRQQRYLREEESGNQTKAKLAELRDALRSLFQDYYSNYDFTYSDPNAVKNVEHAFNDLMQINNELGRKLWSEYAGFRGKKDDRDEWVKCRKCIDKLGHGGNFNDEEWNYITSKQVKVPVLVSYRNLLKKINSYVKGGNLNELGEKTDTQYLMGRVAGRRLRKGDVDGSLEAQEHALRQLPRRWEPGDETDDRRLANHLGYQDEANPELAKILDAEDSASGARRRELSRKIGRPLNEVGDTEKGMEQVGRLTNRQLWQGREKDSYKTREQAFNGNLDFRKKGGDATPHDRKLVNAYWRGQGDESTYPKEFFDILANLGGAEYWDHDGGASVDFTEFAKTHKFKDIVLYVGADGYEENFELGDVVDFIDNIGYTYRDLLKKGSSNLEEELERYIKKSLEDMYYSWYERAQEEYWDYEEGRRSEYAEKLADDRRFELDEGPSGEAYW